MSTKITFSTALKEYQKGQYVPALATLNKLLEIQQDGKTYALLARTFLKVGMKSDAATVFDLAAQQEDANATEYRRQAMQIHFECGNEDAALLVGKRLFQKAPSDPDVAYVLASIFLKRGERSILEGLRKPLLSSANPNHLALASQLMNESYGDENNFLTAQKMLRKTPGNNVLRCAYISMAREVNDYAAIAGHHPIIEAALKKGDTDFMRKEASWNNLIWCGDERINALAQFMTPALAPDATQRRRTMAHAWSDRIRIGYLSSDLWPQHATMKLMRNVIERHDRARFDVHLFCYTPEKDLEGCHVDRETWGRVTRVAGMSDAEAANAIRAQGIDVLVELKGFTTNARPGIVNHQAAPIQVAWLGYPGSSSKMDVDYVIGDRFVLQDTSKPYYHEKFCRMPDTYQPNDPVNRPPLRPVGRQSLGVAEDTFLFASFNHNRKISPETIALWVRILKRCKNSSLLILTTSQRSFDNIIRRFEADGIASERIIFVPKVGYEQHLNRQGAADVALDTFPYNGHTTTSEQLWGGLPVITVKGTNFASRVSESLLNAIGLPELVAEDQDAYVELAVSLYDNPELVAGYKARLEQNRLVAPLFDAERFCRHLESAYEIMAERARNGLEPDHFDVPALPARTAAFR